MGQFTQGGIVYEELPDGNVRVVGYADQPPADPTFPHQGPRAAAAAASAGAGAQVDTATVQAQISKAVADAIRAERAGKTEGLGEGMMWNADGSAAIPIPGYVHKPGDAGVAREEKAADRQRKSAVVRSIMGDVLQKYQRSLRGQPFSRAFGATEKIDALPANEDFRETAMGMLALIRPMVAQGAKDGDSDKEMQVFLSYIPSNDDSDRTIESKLRNLEKLITGVVDGQLPSQMVATGSLGRETDTPLVDGFLSGKGPGGTGGNFLPGGDGGPRAPTGAGGAPAMQTATGERYTTPQDLAAAQAVEEVYRAGGSVQDMLAAVARAGGDPRMEDVAAWQQAVDFRDGTGEYQGKPSGFSDVTPGRSGVRNLAEQVWGDVGASGPGAFAINAADQWAGGGGLDEITGGINSLVKGTDYDAETAYANYGKQAVSAENPGWSLAGGLTGAATQGYGFARAFPGATQALTQGPKSIAATGAIYGALGGGLESNNDRLGGTLVGGTLGAGGGLLGGYAAAPATDAILRTRWGRGLFGTKAPEFTPAERAIPAGSLTPARANMEDAARFNLPYALADSDPKMRVLAGSVARKSPNARELAENTFEPRALGQAERATDVIDTQLAPITDIAERSGQWRQAAQTASAPHYATGRQRPAPVDPRVSAYLETPVGKRALTNAREMAANEGRDPNAMGFDLDDQGEVIIRELPSWETLDYVKRGIDQELEPFRSQITGRLDLESNPAAQSIEGFRQRFLQTLDELNPDYAEARKAYSGQIRNRDALERGGMAADTRVKPRDLPRMTSSFDDTQMGEFRRGFSTRLSDQVNDTSLGANPFSRIYGTPARQEKLNTVFPDAAPNFQRIYGLEKDMAKTAHETLGGSPTAARTAADQVFDSPMGMALDGAIQMGTGGGFSVGNAARVGWRMIGDNWRLGFGQKKADALAPILFDTNPQAMLAYLDDLAMRSAADTVRKGKFRRIGGLFGSVAAPAGAASVVPVS